MIRIEFQAPERDAVWDGWRKKAERRTKDLEKKLRRGQRYKIDGSLYKEPRQIFLRAFHDKCAYCEAKVTVDQHHGDVEHFRPKGRVTDERGRPIEVRGRPGEPRRHHPGYPWLAYNPDNLLPSCLACNRPGTLRTGERVGKWDLFPVSRFRARAPGEETREKPLLLHPVFDDPVKHLALQTQTGRLRGETRRGEVTIRILGLNREGLQEERRRVARSVKALVVAAQCSLDSVELGEARKYLAELESYRDGSAPFSWAGRLTLDALGKTAA